MRFLARLLAGLVAAGMVLGALAIELRPSVPVPAVADAEAAARTRDLARAAAELLRAERAAGEITLPLDQIDALILSARRLAPGFRARAEAEEGRLILEGSAGLPAAEPWIWLNPRLAIASSEEGLAIESVRLGRLPLPPALARRALVAGLDHGFGPGLGEALLAALAGVRVEPDRIALRYALDPEAKDWLYAALKDQVRGFAGGADGARIRGHLWRLDRAGDRGRLPRRGSALPYLAHVAATAGGGEEMKSALLALALYCGESAFGPALGVWVGDHMRGARNHCEGTTLGGRDDLKRHFIVSAGIYAARSGQVAFGMGELKELLDSEPGGSGFSFDDMAADLAGARFARALLEAPEAERAALAERIRSEADVLPPLEGLPRGLTEAEFRARYGDVEGPAYRALIAEIDRRLDAMPLYAGAAGGG